MTSELVKVERVGNAAWVTLNRPSAYNALSKQTNLDLREVAESLAADRQLRAVVITGAGDKAFCAGADLKERKGVSAEQTGAYVNAISGAINAWAELPQATIAMVNGYAFGGGMELMLACDIRVASTNAKMGLTEVRLGIMPGAGGTQRLTRLCGVAIAKRLILTGQRISAAEAAQLGLVSEAVAPGDLRTAVEGIVSELEACAPRSIEMAKAAIDRGFDVPMAEALRIERECYDVTLFTDDRNEGLRAFADKRPPEYTGS